MSQIVCMRLNQMYYKHPDQNNSKRCKLCHAKVGIYPSGQKALQKDPHLEIICNVCADPFDPTSPFDIRPAPGAIQEALEQRRKRQQ
jgi:hypothetical protein